MPEDRSPLDALVHALRRRVAVAETDDDLPQAAVAVILAPDPPRFLLIRRAIRPGDPWSGQLALPGGRRGAGDADLLDTAIRETAEEVGHLLTRDECAAVLDDLAPRIAVLPPIMVRPFVFLVPGQFEPRPNDEVAAVAWTPLDVLVDPALRVDRVLDLPGGPRPIQGIVLPDGILWGMTDRVLTPIALAWKDVRPGQP